MNKRQKNIVTWIVVWAGLLIVVLYSPVGSPGLYSSQNYYAINQSVPVKSGGVMNSLKRTSSSEDAVEGPDIPDISAQHGSNYTTGDYQTANSTSQVSSYYIDNKSIQNTNSASTGGAGVSIIAGGGSRSSNGTSGITMANDLASITSTDISTTNTGSKQRAPSSTQSTSGGTDPGGDPTDPPIPVGDGWGALLLFGGIYALLKRKFTSKKLV